MDPAVEAEVERQMAHIRRATAEIRSEDELAAKLRRSVREKTPLRVKLGVDPTAHDLHLGFTVPLGRMRAFQDLGHQAVLIIGDATAMVGDPSGRNKARPQLTRDQVDDFARSYLEQAALVLDMGSVEVRRNSEWLHEMDFAATARLLARATVAQMLVRDDFSKRYEAQTPIHLHELMYPLMQGWDSVIVRADVELGGIDQLFNLHVGRDMQTQEGMEPQVCVMTPLLVGLDGSRKMSKSFDNYIGITESPTDMFGKSMSIPDEAVRDWFLLGTTEPEDEVDRVLSGDMSPRDVKDALARAVVRRFHGEDAAARASEEFVRVHREKGVPDEMPDVAVPETSLDGDGTIWVVDLVMLSGFSPSKKEARRLVAQGGVTLDGEAVAGEKDRVAPTDGAVLRVGKKRFARVRLEG